MYFIFLLLKMKRGKSIDHPARSEYSIPREAQVGLVTGVTSDIIFF